MRRQFLTWLALLICAAYAVIGVLGYARASAQAMLRAEQLMVTRLHDLLELMQHAENSMQHMEEINNTAAIDRTRALAEILRLDPTALQDTERLQGLCNDLGAEQLAVTDDTGTVIAAVPEENVGYSLDSHEQSREFMDCIHVPGTEICQRMRPSGSTGQIIQYAGVPRTDAHGVVQLGFRAGHEQIVRSTAAFSRLAADFRLGETGRIIAFSSGEMLNDGEQVYPAAGLLSLPSEKMTEITSPGGEKMITYVVDRDGVRLIGMIPKQEIRQELHRTVLSQLLSNLTLFIVVFAALSYLLQRLVVRGIVTISNSLKCITEGNPDERVNVDWTPEFALLSNGINTMVDSLQAYSEQNRLSLERELELARTIQRTALPNKFPPFPHRHEFDLIASCVQARGVGGDFYDFRLTDEDHLSFLVADVSGQGVPAALFMMRSMSAIRGLARSGEPPLTVVSETNRQLCEGNSADMRVNLFYASLQISTGELSFVNTGPPQALLKRAGGEYEMIAMRSGVSLGVLPDASFTECRLQLEPGDRLFVYTSGVVQATDAENTPFGPARLQAALQHPAEELAEVPLNVRAELRSFIGETERRQDVTMLALEYRGRRRTHGSLSFPAGAPESADLLLAEKLESLLAAPVDIADLQSSVNVVAAALPADCEVTLTLRADETEAVVEIRYAISRFNPLISLPHLPVDRTDFRADADGSRLTLTKKLA